MGFFFPYQTKGMYYPKKIVAGIKHAKHVFHGNLIAHIVIATLKGKSNCILEILKENK